MITSENRDPAVNVSILGGGSRGERALEKLVDNVWSPLGENLEPLSEKHNIEVTVVEEDPDRFAEIEDEYGSLSNVEVVNRKAEEWVAANSVSGLIFDAVDTNRRDKVTKAVAENIEDPENTAYWSEKPASKWIEEVSDGGVRVSVDHTESFSSQKQSVIEDIRRGEYEVKSITTWRTSKTSKQVHFTDDASEILGQNPSEIDWEQVDLDEINPDGNYETKNELFADIIELRASRNLLQENAGSSKDKGVHDWANIAATLQAAGIDEVNIDGARSEYREVRVERSPGDIVAYTDSGEAVEVPYGGRERLNDGFSDIRAVSGDADIRVVTALAESTEDEWSEDVEEGMEELYAKFEEGIVEKLGDVSLVYGEEGKEEVRVEYLEAEDPETGGKVEYLVSTGSDMFTLKKAEGNYGVLAYGGTDFLASYLEEGIRAVKEDNSNQTITCDSALRAMELADEAVEVASENQEKQNPIYVSAPKGTPLRYVLEQ